MTQPSFSYRDELALVRYLVGDLERKLAGRHESRIRRTIPSDHCHLGVLGPRDPHVAEPEDLELGEEVLTPPVAEPPERPSLSRAPTTESPETEPESETGAAEAEQITAEQRGSSRDSTRRPPSSLGFEIVVSPLSSAVELTVQASFSVYTQHFPTFMEQREELGRIEQEQEPDATQAQRRQTVSLLDVFERREVKMRPITFVLNTSFQHQRLDDEGLVQQALNDVLAEAAASPTIARLIQGNAVVPTPSLVDEASFLAHLRAVSSGGPRLPPIRVALDIRASKTQEGSIRIRCYLCNNTPRDIAQRYRDQLNIIADCKLSATILKGQLEPVEILPVPKDYQFDRRVWAVGHSASATVSEDQRSIRTQTLARFEQPRRTTNQNPTATFAELAADPLTTLENIRLAMAQYGDLWERDVIENNIQSLSTEELQQCGLDLVLFRDEESRFAAGMAALAADQRLMNAFKAMNRVFARTSKFRSWHLFQIVFIVTQLPALAIRENLSTGEWPQGTPRDWQDTLNWADVLWFPTGGGKTEAYLGLISCSALYDRLRGKHFGVTAWLRFPLRMLSVQQLQRAVRVVWETEQERIQSQFGDPDAAPISLGYFVGPSTPNYLNYGPWALDKLDGDPDLRNRLLLISNCPACGGTKTVQIVVDRTLQRIRHVCSQCQVDLPVYVSDDEVYRFLPTVVVGTIDKMASIAHRATFPMLWGAASWRCPEHPEHGLGMGDWCIKDCPTNPKAGRRPRRRTTITPYDPAPTFHIQDELHLLQQELGAFAGHYETLIRSCEQHVGSVRPPKTIAATATIEGFEHQIRHIYGIPHARRFPTRGYNLLQTFYTSPDIDSESPVRETKTARVYVAFRPPHLHAADAASLCVRLLHEEINRLIANPYEAAAWLPTARTEESVRALLYFYSTTLTYVGSKARGLRIRQSLDREASRLRPGNSRDLNTEFLSGDSTLSAIADVVRRVEDPPGWDQESHLDATVATSVISHGVDVERFNLMVMDSIPEETADYIQASSRSGRRHVGLVLTALASYSLRASSIYHRFNEYHKHLERLVSPVSVNRFAKFAAVRTSPGMFVGLLLGRYGPTIPAHQLKKRRVAAEFLTPGMASQLPSRLNRTEMVRAYREAYALGADVYPEGLELRMQETLDNQLDSFIHLIGGSQKDSLADVVQPKPMSSLRDVDIGVLFRPDENADYRDLQWFNSESQ